MNNLARSLNIPDTIPAACVAIAKSETRLIDVGKINEHAISISQGRRSYEPKIVHRRVTSLRINSEQLLDLQVDGAPQGTTPAFVTVWSGALRVCVSGATALGLQTQEAGKVVLTTAVNTNNIEP